MPAALAAPAPLGAPECGAPSAADRLRSLGDLEAQGLVPDEEFQACRTKTLEGSSARSPVKRPFLQDVNNGTQ